MAIATCNNCTDYQSWQFGGFVQGITYDTDTVTASGSGNYTVTQWYANATGGEINYNYRIIYCNSWDIVETPEQIAARKEAQEKEDLKRKIAAAKAEELLLACISDEQKKQYLEQGYFETIVNDNLYRIKKGRSGNVELIENGKPSSKFCIHPNMFVPDQDTMLAQYLLLHSDEPKFLKLANRTRLL